MSDRELGIIYNTMLGFEDHGIMTFYLHFNFGGSGQGFGGYGLDTPKMKDGKFICRIGTAFGCEVIRRVLQAVGVDKWEDLKGKEMWVIRKGPLQGFASKIVEIEAPKYREGGGRFNIEELLQEMGDDD